MNHKASAIETGFECQLLCVSGDTLKHQGRHHVGVFQGREPGALWTVDAFWMRFSKGFWSQRTRSRLQFGISERHVETFGQFAIMSPYKSHKLLITIYICIYFFMSTGRLEDLGVSLETNKYILQSASLKSRSWSSIHALQKHGMMVPVKWIQVFLLNFSKLQVAKS